MNKKNMIYIIISFLLVFIFITVLIISNKANKVNDNPNTKIVNNKATNIVSVEEVEFRNITKTYNSGITTIKATIYNNSDTVKNIKIKIILKDDNGKEVANMMQSLENLEPKREKVLSTGIGGDYTHIKDIKFEVVD